MNETTISTDTSPKLAKVMELARKDPGLRLRSLAHVLDEHLLTQSFHQLRKDAAIGVDEVTKEEYGLDLAANIRGLHGRMKTARYRHQPIRRVHIPKANGKLRPLGVSCTEDKIVQAALTTLLTAIYEPVFLNCSYGFRPGRSAHDAIKALHGITEKVTWILEADIEAFFDSVDRRQLMVELRKRIDDESLLRLVGKCLHVGVLDGEVYSEPDIGTVQGSVLSPLLGNVYLHYALDEWFARDVEPRLKGAAKLIRYADDCAPRRRGKETARSNGSSYAAREMRAGPSGSGCRTRAQTTGCCSGPMAGVVSETEKAGRTRQVCAVKTNASEPLMTCRKRRDVHRNRAPVVGSGQARGVPADCSRGDRHEDGVSTAQALVRNVGTFRLDAKRELQAEDP
ncbi:MAG TPA: reverse transcriptase domain-containing protein [Rhodothermales bacterium]|nr:reverse transcriptase domain-containing protein [Rhodothermales bacterium]